MMKLKDKNGPGSNQIPSKHKKKRVKRSSSPSYGNERRDIKKSGNCCGPGRRRGRYKEKKKKKNPEEAKKNDRTRAGLKGGQRDLKLISQRGLGPKKLSKASVRESERKNQSVTITGMKKENRKTSAFWAKAKEASSPPTLLGKESWQAPGREERRQQYKRNETKIIEALRSKETA